MKSHVLTLYKFSIVLTCKTYLIMPTLSCTAGWLVFTVINAIIGISLSSTISFAFYKFIKDTTSLSKTRRISASIFIISSIMALIWIVLWTSENTGCLPIPTALAKYPFYLFLAIQLYVIIIIFFAQLRVVFEGTDLAISDSTRLIFKILLITTPIFIVVAIILSVFGFRSAFLILGSLVVILLLGMTIAIVIMFTTKLISVYIHDNRHNFNEALFKVMRKSTILTTLSTLSTLLNVVSLVFEGIDPGIYVVIETIMMYLDVYTSALCVIMCFATFNSYYDIFCGCLDRICVRCWTSLIITDQNTEMMVKNLESQASQGSNHTVIANSSITSLDSKTQSK
eukprot:450564_1